MIMVAIKGSKKFCTRTAARRAHWGLTTPCGGSCTVEQVGLEVIKQRIRVPNLQGNVQQPHSSDVPLKLTRSVAQLGQCKYQKLCKHVVYVATSKQMGA
jgi:hypothetical protein